MQLAFVAPNMAGARRGQVYESGTSRALVATHDEREEQDEDEQKDKALQTMQEQVSRFVRSSIRGRPVELLLGVAGGRVEVVQGTCRLSADLVGLLVVSPLESTHIPMADIAGVDRHVAGSGADFDQALSDGLVPSELARLLLLRYRTASDEVRIVFLLEASCDESDVFARLIGTLHKRAAMRAECAKLFSSVGVVGGRHAGLPGGRVCERVRASSGAEGA